MKMICMAGIAASAVSCAGGGSKSQDGTDNFRYLIDEFADLKIMKYQVPGWDDLSLQQKEYVYHLSEAAKYGRDIIWVQNCRYNLPIRKVLENILENYEGDRECREFQDFTVYAKRVFFSNGIHHHYAEDKIFPDCPQDYFRSLMEAVGDGDRCEELLPVIYDPEIFPQRKSNDPGKDIVQASAVNFYENVTRKEVEDFYHAMLDPQDDTPVSYGLNSKVVKGSDGVIREEVYRTGGLYGPALTRICSELEKAAEYAENDAQKQYIATLVEYYRTGDLKLWDKYNIEWVQDTLGTVDFVNGFVEDYNDPLGRKATWEGLVNIKDHDASQRTEILSANAQWFEDNSPVDPRFRKPQVKGISAKVINAVALAGDCYPSTPIGINLPNADWIRRDYGSKSVTIANITHAYDLAAQESPRNLLSEFAWSEEEIALEKKYSAITDEIHTDLHECLGHGSGRTLPGVSPNALGEYSSTLEETRADLFGLYYIADPKLVELGILPDMEAYKAQYANYIRNGIMVQFNRVELGKKNTEAHMQNRKLIAEWCYEQGRDGNVIEKKVRDGKTYFVVNDFEALRGLFARLLAEVQRIKSEGDYEAGKALVEKYAVDIDPRLHREVKTRYEQLGLKPYGGFVNPEIVPVKRGGKTVDYRIEYTDDYLGQMLEYGKKYATL
ncbi:MAG: dihydrofolate reductase [Bacteroidetes bacterium]|uniref:Dihydrofolate reductase n=1 Tax=Candidatus Cryptobacteroides gallistercoris TaxID=2840765 RepID=A0A940IFN3_9BACT|nr:dihydrofolate reductase [Candidatus Cryptobacteroides gallistercoris]